MQIYVNNTPLDFTLNKPTSLENVLTCIQEWAITDKLYVLNYEVTSEYKKNNIQTLLSTNIDRLDVSLGSIKELVLESTQEVERYLDTLGVTLWKDASEATSKNKVLEEYTFMVSQDIKNGFTWVTDALDPLLLYCLPKDSREEDSVKLNTESSDNIRDNLSNIMSEIEKYISKEVWSLDDISILLQYIGVIKYYVTLWFEKVQFTYLTVEDAKRHWEEFITHIPKLKVQLEETAINLTVGKELDALKALEEMLHYLLKVFFLLYKIKGEGDLINKVISILNELVNKLSEGDILTAADIIDFDLKDLLTDLENL